MTKSADPSQDRKRQQKLNYIRRKRADKDYRDAERLKDKKRRSAHKYCCICARELQLDSTYVNDMNCMSDLDIISSDLTALPLPAADSSALHAITISDASSLISK
jgi:hypothetical protein